METVVVAQHVAHLNKQVLLSGGGDDALPLRPVVAGSLVVPYVLSSSHDFLGLVEALDVKPFGRHGYDSGVGQHLPRRLEPVHGRIAGIGICELRAVFYVWFIDADQFNIWILLHGNDFACSVRVLCPVLGHLDRHGNSLSGGTVGYTNRCMAPSD